MTPKPQRQTPSFVHDDSTNRLAQALVGLSDAETCRYETRPNKCELHGCLVTWYGSDVKEEACGES